jgi:cyclophilin family peptidyl-prolyl cis-trans isomerase
MKALMLRLFCAAAVACAISPAFAQTDAKKPATPPASTQPQPKTDPKTEAPKPAVEDVSWVELKTSMGTIVIEVDGKKAPISAANFLTYVSEGFYDGTVFHRVIEGFMAQGGDPTGTGTGGSDLGDIRAEFTNAKFVRGTCGMARSQSPNSANSQFFIMFEPAPHLNGQYTVWGQVVEGMEHVDAIKRGAGGSGSVSDPDKIVKASIAADAA